MFDNKYNVIGLESLECKIVVIVKIEIIINLVLNKWCKVCVILFNVLCLSVLFFVVDVLIWVREFYVELF